jgi:hypothetical protein
VCVYVCVCVWRGVGFLCTVISLPVGVLFYKHLLLNDPVLQPECYVLFVWNVLRYYRLKDSFHLTHFLVHNISAMHLLALCIGRLLSVTWFTEDEQVPACLPSLFVFNIQTKTFQNPQLFIKLYISSLMFLSDARFQNIPFSLPPPKLFK